MVMECVRVNVQTSMLVLLIGMEKIVNVYEVG